MTFYFYFCFTPLIRKGHGAKGDKWKALTLAKLLGVPTSSETGLPASEPKTGCLEKLRSPQVAICGRSFYVLCLKFIGPLPFHPNLTTSNYH